MLSVFINLDLQKNLPTFINHFVYTYEHTNYDSIAGFSIH